MELQRLQLAFDQQKADWQQAQFNTVLENIRLMKETFGMDERDRIYYKGVIQTHMSHSLVSSSSTALITAGENVPMLLENDSRGREISIPMVAAELGYRIRDKSSAIGKKWQKNGERSTQVKTHPNTRRRPTEQELNANTYYERDREMMEESIREVMGEKTIPSVPQISRTEARKNFFTPRKAPKKS
jgi:hypothetical protein